MRVGNILGKFSVKEWGGTETYITQIYAHLKDDLGVESTFFLPKEEGIDVNPLEAQGHPIRPFKLIVPTFGLTDEEKAHHIALGSNIISFDLPKLLLKEKNLDIIHSHTLRRLGAMGMWIAKLKRIPFVVTVHGWDKSFPFPLDKKFMMDPYKGWDWGKIFNVVLSSRGIIKNADAIVTVGERECSLLKDIYPEKEVTMIPAGVPVGMFDRNCVDDALEQFPQLIGKKVLLIPSRIDPIKNQKWLVDLMPRILEMLPDAILVLAGGRTHENYLSTILADIYSLHLEKRVILTGALPYGDPVLIGLMQLADVIVQPSLIEPFGLATLEAWAAKTVVFASRTDGSKQLIKDGVNGFMFQLSEPEEFLRQLRTVILNKELQKQVTAEGYAKCSRYDSALMAEKLRSLYDSLLSKVGTTVA